VPVHLRRLLQVVAILVLAGLVGLFANSLRSSSTSVRAEVEGGGRPQAPDFSLTRIGGSGDVRLSAQRSKLVLVNFWASWCAPCREETPLLVRWANRYRGRGLTVIGVDSQDFVGDARRFAKQYGVTYPLAHDASNDLMRRWGVTGFPETFLVDQQGRVVHAFTPGPVDDASLRKYVLPHLEQQSS
jgi:cytochrome c biogenesis protein CcmG, thiol:disulfide interchange protein DsbE